MKSYFSVPNIAIFGVNNRLATLHLNVLTFNIFVSASVYWSNPPYILTFLFRHSRNSWLMAFCTIIGQESAIMRWARKTIKASPWRDALMALWWWERLVLYFLSSTSYLLWRLLYSGTISFIFLTISMSSYCRERS